MQSKMKKDVQKTFGQIYVERPVKHWLGPNEVTSLHFYRALHSSITLQADQAMSDPESCCSRLEIAALSVVAQFGQGQIGR